MFERCYRSVCMEGRKLLQNMMCFIYTHLRILYKICKEKYQLQESEYLYRKQILIHPFSSLVPPPFDARRPSPLASRTLPQSIKFQAYHTLKLDIFNTSQSGEMLRAVRRRCVTNHDHSAVASCLNAHSRRNSTHCLHHSQSSPPQHSTHHVHLPGIGSRRV